MQPSISVISKQQSETFSEVTLLAHTDWSKHPSKRWMSFAILQANCQWFISDVVNIVQPSEFFSYLKTQMIHPGCILAGFDFPIGLPHAYALRTGITNFLTALSRFGESEWAEFYNPAENPSEISVYRPFYPARPGNSKRNHLEQALNIPFTKLFRLCEIAHDNRRPACPLFWTMGAQQVGKAAISGWESLLAPAIHDPTLKVKIWPFSGPMHDLCSLGNLVVVETYPAEFYTHLGLSFSVPIRRSKRRQVDRVSFAPLLINWAQANAVGISTSLITKIQEGFGRAVNGEDQFDALVGLYGMINVIMGNHSFGEPSSPVISNIEGWIFGQEQPHGGIFSD